jgi:hypothetical protein
VEKVHPKILATSFIFKGIAQRKQSPNGQKFAQSGHPAHKPGPKNQRMYFVLSDADGRPDQGCQMVCFQTQNPNLGKFLRVLDWKILIYLMAIWNILWRFGIFYGHLVRFVFIWYTFSRFGIMYQEKSGNPGYDNYFALITIFKTVLTACHSGHRLQGARC